MAYMLGILGPRPMQIFLNRFLMQSQSLGSQIPCQGPQSTSSVRRPNQAGAFAALCAGGRVVTWGDPSYGGDSTEALVGVNRFPRRPKQLSKSSHPKMLGVHVGPCVVLVRILCLGVQSFGFRHWGLWLGRD